MERVNSHFIATISVVHTFQSAVVIHRDFMSISMPPPERIAMRERAFGFGANENLTTRANEKLTTRLASR